MLFVMWNGGRRLTPPACQSAFDESAFDRSAFDQSTFDRSSFDQSAFRWKAVWERGRLAALVAPQTVSYLAFAVTRHSASEARQGTCVPISLKQRRPSSPGAILLTQDWQAFVCSFWPFPPPVHAKTGSAGKTSPTASFY